MRSRAYFDLQKLLRSPWRKDSPLDAKSRPRTRGLVPTTPGHVTLAHTATQQRPPQFAQHIAAQLRPLRRQANNVQLLPGSSCSWLAWASQARGRPRGRWPSGGSQRIDCTHCHPFQTTSAGSTSAPTSARLLAGAHRHGRRAAAHGHGSSADGRRIFTPHCAVCSAGRSRELAATAPAACANGVFVFTDCARPTPAHSASAGAIRIPTQQQSFARTAAVQRCADPPRPPALPARLRRASVPAARPRRRHEQSDLEGHVCI